MKTAIYIEDGPELDIKNKNYQENTMSAEPSEFAKKLREDIRNADLVRVVAGAIKACNLLDAAEAENKRLREGMEKCYNQLNSYNGPEIDKAAAWLEKALKEQ